MKIWNDNNKWPMDIENENNVMDNGSNNINIQQWKVINNESNETMKIIII
jgi:hypothetical protein